MPTSPSSRSRKYTEKVIAHAEQLESLAAVKSFADFVELQTSFFRKQAELAADLEETITARASTKYLFSNAVKTVKKKAGTFSVENHLNWSALLFELKKNTISAEIAVGKLVSAGISVDQVMADKDFASRMIISGIIPRRTLEYASEKKNDRFSTAQSERIVRALRITELAKEAFGDKADEWLDRPTTVFSGATPAEMLVTEAGARAVEMFIGQAMHGFAA